LTGYCSFFGSFYNSLVPANTYRICLLLSSVLCTLLCWGCLPPSGDSQHAELQQRSERCEDSLERQGGRIELLEGELRALEEENLRIRTLQARNQADLKGIHTVHALLATSMGSVRLELYPDRAPRTVANFVALAEGKRTWIDPQGQERRDTPYYDGLTIHRVVPGFVIQGGDPKGDGTGGPGYTFPDEFDPSLRHEGPGVLSMANSGADTNGSQFFITLRAAPELDAFDIDGSPKNCKDKSVSCHAVFGRVLQGMDVVEDIAAVPASNEHPEVPVLIKSLRILRNP